MTNPKSAKTSTTDRAKSLQVKRPSDHTSDRALADIALDPLAAAMATTNMFNSGSFGVLSVTDTFNALHDQAKALKGGDQSLLRNLLVGQSLALNAIFTELARRAGLNMGEHIHASERYMRLALKAQSQCRATVDALDRLANGREQTVRHVHVDNRGGQAIIGETVHTGGQENAEANKQPHTLESGTAAFGQPLWSENAERATVPLSSDA